MELLPQLKSELQALGASIGAEMKKSLDERDTALIERMSKMHDAKLTELRAEFASHQRSAAIPGLARDAKEVKDFKLAKLIRGKLTGDFSDCGLELEMCAAAADEYGEAMPNVLARLHRGTDRMGNKLKDMSTISDPAGGFIVPAQVFSSLFIERLTARSAIAQLQPTIMDGLTTAPIDIPGEAGGVTAAWQGENDTAAQSEPTFRMIEAYPHLLGVRSVLSNRLANMSIPAAEVLVRRIIQRDVAIKSDQAAINGSSASGEPIGILQATGINTYDFSSRKVSDGTGWNDLQGMVNELIIDNAYQGNLRWLLSPDVALAIKQRVDKGTNTNDNQPTERRILTAASPDMLLGHPYVVSTNAPAKTLMLGNWDDFFWLQWGTLFLQVDSLTVLGKFQIQLLAGLEMDFQQAHAESFVVATGAGIA